MYNKSLQRKNEVRAFHDELIDEQDIADLKSKILASGLSISELVSDRNLLHREMIVEVDHPQQGAMKQAGIMVKLSATPGRIAHVDPQPSDFTEAILGEAGYTQTEIADLREAGVVD